MRIASRQHCLAQCCLLQITGCDFSQVRSSFFCGRLLCTSSPPFRKVISSHRRLCGEIATTFQRCFVCQCRQTNSAFFFDIPHELDRIVHRAEIAQLVEHAAENRSVRSSILRLGISSIVAFGSWDSDAFFTSRSRVEDDCNFCYNRVV